MFNTNSGLTVVEVKNVTPTGRGLIKKDQHRGNREIVSEVWSLTKSAGGLKTGRSEAPSTEKFRGVGVPLSGVFLSFLPIFLRLYHGNSEMSFSG